MAESGKVGGRRDAQAIGALIGRVIEPVCAKRGFATADLIGAWDDIVGPRYAGTTQPEKIAWPRGDRSSGATATLVIRVDAGMAIYLQHETSLILDRINGFLGFRAIGALRIVQGPVAQRRAAAAPTERPVSADEAAAIGAALDGMENEGLRDSLERLGRRIYAEVSRT